MYKPVLLRSIVRLSAVVLQHKSSTYEKKPNLTLFLYHRHKRTASAAQQRS